MAVFHEIKNFLMSGMDYDSAIEVRDKNSYYPAYNIRPQGTQGLDEGYITNIESNQFLSASVNPGINRCIGSAGFESARIGIEVYYNSAGYNEIREIDYDTGAITRIPINSWPLDPNHYVNDIDLINNTFLCMNDGYNPPFYANYNTLKSGGYGTLTENDLMLIKPQPQFPPSGYYASDSTRSVNLLSEKLFQFKAVWQFMDYEESATSTCSSRIIPPQESVPGQAPDVTVNNCEVVTVPCGNNRVSNILIYSRYGTLDWFQIQEVAASKLLSLPATIDLTNRILEAYDPVNNLYSFVFYYDGLYENIDPLVTDQLYDNVPLIAGAQVVLNGNQLAYGDVTTGYDRPNTPVLLSTSNYNPNIQLSPSAATNPFEYSIINPGESGSGEGNHRRLVVLEFGGYIQENDYVTINLVDIRNSANVQTYQLPPCPGGQVGNTASYIASNAPSIPGSSTYTPTDGQLIGLNIVTSPYFTLQSVFITLYNAGAGIYKSIHALKGNSGYQLALLHYDYWGRPFPIQTDNTYILKTNSYAQSHGNTPQINWQLQSASAPANAYTYQWAISPNNTHQRWLFSFASIVQVAGSGTGTYNAGTNTFVPSSAGATAGQAWRVNNAGTQNLGNGSTSFNIDDWVISQGNGAFVVVPSTYGDLSDSTAYYFYFNSLQNYDNKYNSSILTYSYTPGDRCTLHNYQNASGIVGWFDGVNNPCIDVEVQGYDTGVFFLKVNRTSAIDPATLLGYNVLMEVYTPKPRTSTTAGVTTNNATVFYEIGTAYPIVNGQYSVLSGVITEGDNYFKTRQLGGSVDTNNPYYLVVEDPNYSDFYTSNYWSAGRPRTYNDVLSRTEQIANIVYSQQYVIGSQTNGLATFYVANVYGDTGGQTSSNFGNIVKLIHINNYLICLQKNNHCSIPVYIQIIEDQAEQQNVAISQSILGNARYTMGKHIGVGTAKESIAVYNNIIYWIDSNRNEPIRWEGAGMGNGAVPIGEKMTKYFRQSLQTAFSEGLKVIGWYDIFNDEYIISIQQLGGISQSFAFNTQLWATKLNFVILPGQITLATNPLHSSPSYNNITGICVITPSTNYVGSDSFIITTGISPSRNVCYSWTAGSGTVYAFSFISQTGVPLSTEIQSNIISVGGNDYAVPISITGGQYSVNGGAFTSAVGTVNNGDTVQVEVLSSGSNNTSTSCTLTIDSQSATFTVTTAAAGNFTAYANYGLGIVGITGGSGIPAGFNPCNLTSGNAKSAVYTTLGAGTYTIQLSGTAYVPAKTRVGLTVGGVLVSSDSAASGSGFYTLTLGSPASDPITVLFSIYQTS